MSEEEKVVQVERKKFPIILKVIIPLIVIIILLVVATYIWYTSSINAVDKNNIETKIVEIESGKGVSGIAETLKENNLIKNVLSFRIYCKLNKVNNLQAGTYELDSNMNVEKIVNKLQLGDVIKKDVTIMFPEGKNIRTIAKIISDNTNNTYDEAMSIFENKNYAKILIEKYWFLTNEILDKNIYYPLEGYLFPNTYTFEDSNVSIETIVEKMLDETDKVLSKYKFEINSKGYTMHEFLSLASVVECEGTNTENRQGIAGVFLNRLKEGMALQSDVTTYYAFKIDFGERDLTYDELNTYNPYNTRGSNMEGLIPIGPVSNISESSIKATLNPTNTDSLFFVADKNGKVYFSRTLEEHNQIITKLQNQGLWYTYD